MKMAQRIDRHPKKQRTKYFGFKSLLSIPIIIILITYGAYSISSSFRAWDLFIEDYEVDFDYEERVVEAPNPQQRPFHTLSRPPKDDPHSLLDIKYFKLIHTISAPFCNHRRGYMKILVILIKSARENYKSRKLIRQTYGSLHQFQGWLVQPVFLIGTDSSSESEAIQLQEESAFYGDTIVARLSENPQDSVYIHLMGYKWVANHCRTTNFVLKANDNVYIDTFQVIDTLSQLRSSVQNIILCRKRYNQLVNRNKVSREDFEPETFPTHCSSQAVIMSFDALDRIYAAALLSKKVLRLEEVWTTGILGKETGAVVLDIGYKYRFTYRMEIESVANRGFGGYKKLPWMFLTLPKLDIVKNDLFRLWNHTLIVNSS